MDKNLLELSKALKELNEIIKDITNEDESETKGEFKKALNKAFKEKASISVEKLENGKSKILINGSALAILIILAGLEKGILERIKIPTTLWKAIKDTVGTREDKEAE